MVNILIVYYSLNGSTLEMAEQIAAGVQGAGANFTLRTVPKVSTVTEKIADDIPPEGPPYIQNEDIKNCDGLLLGSPTRFGNMAAPMKYFIDGLSQDWLQGTLAGKPAGVFTSASSLHGGHESTLLTMMIPLLHLGALITGIPYHGNPELMETSAGGTPYGPSYWVRSNLEMTQEENKLCYALGYRVAMIAKRLKNL